MRPPVGSVLGRESLAGSAFLNCAYDTVTQLDQSFEATEPVSPFACSSKVMLMVSELLHRLANVSSAATIQLIYCWLQFAVYVLLKTRPLPDALTV